MEDTNIDPWLKDFRESRTAYQAVLEATARKFQASNKLAELIGRVRLANAERKYLKVSRRIGLSVVNDTIDTEGVSSVG
jgi:hypothetical protein